jgi:hypothetical protein
MVGTFVAAIHSFLKLVRNRDARFFFVQCTKTVKNYQLNTKLPNGCNIFQKAIKCTNIFQSKSLPNLPKMGIFGLKMYHLATLFFKPTGRIRALLGI